MQVAHGGRRRGWVAGLAVALIILFAATRAVDSGWLWERLASSSRFWQVAAIRGGNATLQVAPNLAAAARPHVPGEFSVSYIGSSTTAFAFDVVAIERDLERQGRPADIRRTWLGSTDMVGVYYLTQQVLRQPPDVVVLGLSPAMTQIIVGEELAAARQYRWYQDRRTVPPPLAAYGEPAAPTEGCATRLEQWWSLYRFRDVFRSYAAVGMRMLTDTIPPHIAAAPEPDIWFARQVDAVPFAEARARYRETGESRLYLEAYDHFPPGRAGVVFWHDVFERAVWAAPNAQWAAFAAWVDLIRAGGSVPVVALLPYNPFFSQPGSGRLMGVAEDDEAYIDPQRYRRWLQDVESFCRARHTLLVNDFRLYPPEAFYDLHHLMPEARAAYSALWVERLPRLGEQ